MSTAVVSHQKLSPWRGKAVPGIPLESTAGSEVDLSAISGLSVVFVQPGASNPNNPPTAQWLDGWKAIRGAAGCTGQCKTFNDALPRFEEVEARVFGLSGQTAEEQKSVQDALGLGFTLLSDSDASFLGSLGFGQFQYQGRSFHPRFTLVIKDGKFVNLIGEIEDPAKHVVTLAASIA